MDKYNRKMLFSGIMIAVISSCMIFLDISSSSAGILSIPVNSSNPCTAAPSPSVVPFMHRSTEEVKVSVYSEIVSFDTMKSRSPPHRLRYHYRLGIPRRYLSVATLRKERFASVYGLLLVQMLPYVYAKP